MDQQIHLFLCKLRRRLSVQLALDLFPYVLSAGSLLGIVHVLPAIFYPLYYANALAIFWIAVSFFLGILYFLLHTPKEIQAAHIGDTIFKKDRLLTSLELRGNDSDISRLQKEDTLSRMTACDIRKEFPFHVHRKRTLFCFLSLGIFFFLFLLPSDAKSEAYQLHAIRQKTKEEIAALEQLQQELEQEKEMETNSQTEKDIAQKTSTEKTFAAQQTTKELSSEQETEADKNDTTAKTPETLGGKLLSCEAYDSVQALMERAQNELSAAQSQHDIEHSRVKLTSALSSYAENAITEFPEASEAFSELLEKIQQIQENTNQTSQTTNKNGNVTSKESGASSTSENNNQETTKNPSQTSEPTNNNQNSQSSHYSSKADNPSEQKNQHQLSQNSSKGDGSSNLSSSKNNSGTKNTGFGKDQGSAAGLQRESKQQEPEQITIIQEALGSDQALTGTAQEHGNSQKQSGSQPLSAGTKQNFEDVLGDYTKNAYAALDNHKIPASMESIVRDYFNNLNS